MAAINSADEAAAWAHRNLPAKNTLTAADAKIVEERFQARLSSIGDLQASEATSDDPAPGGTPDGPVSAAPLHAVADQNVVSISATHAGTSQKASKGAQKRPGSRAVHALGRTVRLRDKDHRKFVLRQP